ncbi:Rxt3-domain-containing protein [Viridothelium virens]|uniref:Rxt3-domain-containing protein n=1 Tax=Viridothelium virens TaxID=1048519 RepID=A0A6A6HFJ9_VIRVR|nr:Rxt3-domain-containing protein [Viridothelium virens]
MDHQRHQSQQLQQSRQPERGLVHNSHQQPPPHQAHSFPSFPPPPVSQAPVHVPFSADPFSRRDPFIGSNQQNRRDSYGFQNRDTGQGSSGDRGVWMKTPGTVTHNLHPSPPTTANGPDYMSHSFDTARRRSLGAGPAAHQYGAPLDPPPPPPPPPHPPSLGGRTMLPPSSSQQPSASSAFSNPLSRGHPPPPSSFGPARDLVPLNAAHRPGSSMSISSMLGSDSSAPNHVSSSSSAAASSAPSTSARPMQPPSPRRRLSNTFGQYSQQTSSDKPYSSNGSRSEGTQSGGAGSPGHTFNTKTESPEFTRSLQPSISQSSAALGFRSFQPPSGESQDRSENRSNSTSVPPRPNSQPVGPREPTFSPAKPGKPDGHIARVFHDVAFEPRRLQEGPNRNPGSHDFQESPSNPTNLRGRANTMQPTTHSAFSPPGERVVAPYQSRDYSHPISQQQEWNSPSLLGRNSRDLSREHASDVFRPNLHSQPVNSRFPSTDSRSLSDDIKQYRSADRPTDRIEGGLFGSARSPERIANPISQASSLANGPSSQSRLPSFDHRMTASEDPSPQQRSLLGVSPELNRTRARGSPLPQAVQGAQPHRSGPGDGPGVKHEFGRMFSGLGSGVGSNTPIAGMTANGSSTPGRQTPTRAFDEVERVNPSLDIDPEGVSLVREVSRGGRKGRRIKDEDKLGSDSGESRATPGFSGQRGSKRAKTSHPSHHFHVTAHGHHHHHTQPPDDELSFVGSTPSMPQNATPFNPLKFQSTYQSQPIFSSPSQPHHHHGHHHHHASPHHHHHPPKSHHTVSQPHRRPRTRILSQPILASVSHLPRHHLGSALYKPGVSAPASTTPSTITLKHGFTSRARPLPRFDASKANCTFTIRVPRYYLHAAQREAVCGARCLWGTDVYTDDSDPLAACIHGGWVKGEWGEDVDSELLGKESSDSSGRNGFVGDLDDEDGSAGGDEAVMAHAPRSGPVAPPDGRDLHITVLILPPLEEYASTTGWGMKSRRWGGNHDGMSFKILRLEWVDEGMGRAEERSGAARRRRLAGRSRLMREMMMGGIGPGRIVEGVA